MNLKSRLATVAGLGIAGSLLGASAALAAPAPAPAPHVYKATTHLVNRPDGGDAGTWAQDNLWRTVKFVQVPDGITGQWEYQVTLTDRGSFKTDTDVLAPNQAAPFVGVKTGHYPIRGSVNGGGTYTIVTNSPISNLPNLGVPAFEYGTPTGNETTGNWPALAFASSATVTNPGIQNWSWTYNAKHVLTGFHKVVTWNKVFTGYKWELVTTWKNGHKTLKWERVAQFKQVAHTSYKPIFQHEQYVDALAGEQGEIAGL